MPDAKENILHYFIYVKSKKKPNYSREIDIMVAGGWGDCLDNSGGKHSGHHFMSSFRWCFMGVYNCQNLNWTLKIPVFKNVSSILKIWQSIF